MKDLKKQTEKFMQSFAETLEAFNELLENVLAIAADKVSEKPIAEKKLKKAKSKPAKEAVEEAPAEEVVPEEIDYKKLRARLPVLFGKAMQKIGAKAVKKMIKENYNNASSLDIIPNADLPRLEKELKEIING